ncbi:hypothetical protein [Eubacterium callanderi]|uniref:hypothetical protein n=1 Tax=Eubacterium callanderi TaxID=53442 RepID=UPI003918B31E
MDLMPDEAFLVFSLRAAKLAMAPVVSASTITLCTLSTSVLIKPFSLDVFSSACAESAVTVAFAFIWLIVCICDCIRDKLAFAETVSAVTYALALAFVKFSRLTLTLENFESKSAVLIATPASIFIFSSVFA